MKTKMTKEEIRQIAPTVFTEGAHADRSEKYTFIPTSRVIDDMELLGWNVVGVQQSNSKVKAGYQKHLIRFQNPDVWIDGEDQVYPEVLLINSHDGSSSFQFRVGIFRLICSNGLVISTQDFNKIKIKHMGYSFDELQNTLKSIIDSLPLAVESMNKMKSIELEQDQMVDLAKQVLSIRFNNENVECDIMELLEPTRPQDSKNDLWTVFNRLQERMIRGSFNYVTTKNKTRKARPVKNIDQDIKLNQEIFQAAYNMIPA